MATMGPSGRWSRCRTGRAELLRLPGVRAAESNRFIAVALVHGHRRERSQIRGYATVPELYRSTIDAEQHGDSLVLTDRLAAKLGVQVGDVLQVDVLEGRARTLYLPVDATVREMMGLNTYMNRDALNRALGDGDLSTGFMLSIARRRIRRAGGDPRHAPRGRHVQQGHHAAQHQEVSARNIRIVTVA